MSILVRIPGPLRDLVDNKTEVTVEATSVREAVQQFAAQSNEVLKTRLLDDSGELRRFINIWVNNEDVKFLQKLDTQLESGDEVSIIPSIAGGR